MNEKPKDPRGDRSKDNLRIEHVNENPNISEDKGEVFEITIEDIFKGKIEFTDAELQAQVAGLILEMEKAVTQEEKDIINAKFYELFRRKE